MTIQSVAGPTVHLHWVRETPSRGLYAPVSKTLNSLKTLPPSARNAVRETGLAAVELHLPPYRPALTPNPEEWLENLRFRQDAAGRVVGTIAGDPCPLATMAQHQAIVLALRASSGDTTPLTIVAETQSAPVLRQPLAMRHRCADQGGLANAPAERAHNYDRAYKAIALAAQRAIRELVPPAHIESVAALEDRAHSHSLLAWSAAAAVTGRYVDQLGVDVLDEAIMKRAANRMPDRLAPMLEECHGILVRYGAEPRIRDGYHPKRVAQIIDQCRSNPRYMNSLFFNELRLITAFVTFCNRIQDWRATGDPVKIFREVRSAWEDVEAHLRNFFQRRSFPAVGSRLLLEAVQALEAID